MKRAGQLFEKAFSMDALYTAFISASKGKHKTKSYLLFTSNLGDELYRLYREIHIKEYKPSAYRELCISTPKPRIIHAPCFRDVVIQHAIYNVVYPIFNAVFINTSMACRIGKGTHAASNYAYSAMQIANEDTYTLHLDIRKFFASIDHAVLQKLIVDKIKDYNLISVMLLFFGPYNHGIVLGNLLSQLYALIYLNPVDHYIKRVLKVDKYVRYVDDMMFIGMDKERTSYVKNKVTNFLDTILHLQLSKWSMCKISKGINFVGYRTWSTHRLIRKYSLAKYKKAIKTNDVNVAWSLIAHAKNTSSIKRMREVLMYNPKMVNSLPLTHKRRLGL